MIVRTNIICWSIVSLSIILEWNSSSYSIHCDRQWRHTMMKKIGETRNSIYRFSFSRSLSLPCVPSFFSRFSNHKGISHLCNHPHLYFFRWKSIDEQRSIDRHISHAWRIDMAIERERAFCLVYHRSPWSDWGNARACLSLSVLACLVFDENQVYFQTIESNWKRISSFVTTSIIIIIILSILSSVKRRKRQR